MFYLKEFTQLVIQANGVTITTEFKDIALGYDSTLAITMQGELFGFGSNEYYQLGIGNHKNKDGHLPTRILIDPNIKLIQAACSRGSAHHCHGIVLDEEGAMYSFGSGYKFKLGTKNIDDQPVPVKVDLLSNIKIAKIIPGGIHNLALTTENSLVSFGCGSDGRLGHQESANHHYLYKELEPRQISSLGNKVLLADSEYYFGVALCME